MSPAFKRALALISFAGGVLLLCSALFSTPHDGSPSTWSDPGSFVLHFGEVALGVLFLAGGAISFYFQSMPDSGGLTALLEEKPHLRTALGCLMVIGILLFILSLVFASCAYSFRGI